MITEKAFGKNHFQGTKSEFLIRYQKSHGSSEFDELCGTLKYEIYRNPDEMEVCKWVVEAEHELHKDSREVYECVLVNFGGSLDVTSRIADPEGGVIYKMSSKVDQALKPRKIKWYIFKIIAMFALLCLHMPTECLILALF